METTYRDRTLSEWIDDLQNGDVADRCAAALALAEIGPEKQAVMSALVNAVLDPDKAVQLASAIAIGVVPIDEGARRNILSDLLDGDATMRDGWVNLLRMTHGSGNAPSTTPRLQPRDVAEEAAADFLREADATGIAAGEPAAEAFDWHDATSGAGSATSAQTSGLTDDIRMPRGRRSSSRPRAALAAAKPLVFARTALDRRTRAYLAGVAEREGAGLPGVFIPLGSMSARAVLCWGLVLLGVTLASCWPACYLAPPWDRAYLAVQAVLATLTCLVLMQAGRRWHAEHHNPGSFIYADRSYLWEVQPLRVKVVPLANVSGAHSTPTVAPVPGWDHVVLDVRGREYRLDALPTASSDKLVAFIRDRAGTGAAATAVDDDVPVLAPPSIGQWLWRLVPGLAAVLMGGALAVCVLFAVDRLLREEFLHMLVVQAGATDAQPHRQYLAEFRGGRYVDDVQTRLLDVCRAQADREAGPEPLRKFLKECSKDGLRGEALRELGRSYERTSTEFAKAATAANGRPELINGFVTLLKTLGGSDDEPVVTLAWRGRHDGEPANEMEKLMEQLARTDVKHGVLKDPPGDLFAAGEMRERERLLFARLENALMQRLPRSAAVLKLEPGPRPAIEVAYHIRPSGGFFTWREKYEGKRSGPGPNGVGNDPLGLLKPPANPFGGLGNDPLRPLRPFDNAPLQWLVRQYTIDWTVTIRPRNRGVPFSAGGNYTNQHRDLQWTTTDVLDRKRDPYVYVLDLMMLDFSDQLISAFGLPPQSPPAIDAAR